MPPTRKPSKRSAGPPRFPNNRKQTIPAPQATDDLDACIDRFRELLEATAQQQGLRRAKVTLDDGDVQAAWRQLLTNDRETQLRPLLTDAGLLLAGVFASSGVSLGLCNPNNWPAAALVTAAGVVIGGLAALLRYGT